MVQFRDADDRRGNLRFMEEPCQRYLSARHAARCGYFTQPLDNEAVVGFRGGIEGRKLWVELTAFRRGKCIRVACDAAASKGTPREKSDAFGPTKREHLALVFALD